MTTTAPQPTEPTTLASGRVVAIAGPVIDVEFPPHALPEINGAVEVDVDVRGAPRPSPPRWPSRSATAVCGASA